MSLIYACSATASRLNAKFGQIQAVVQQLQQREQANQQATHHKEQSECTAVQLAQQLGQLLHTCQQEISQLASQPLNTWPAPYSISPQAMQIPRPQAWMQPLPGQPSFLQ